MYELVFTSEREERSPLHLSVTNAVEYAEANAEDHDEFEVWQVADDANRTRMVMIQGGMVFEGVAHYYARRD
jgi:hypothetical protein